MRHTVRTIALFSLIASAPQGQAAELITQSLDGSISLSGSAGLMTIEANELVYDGGQRISRLVWESDAVGLVNGTLDMELQNSWKARFSASGGFGGDSDMTDYDWIAPFSTGEGMDDWSDRSRHPDTKLDHYYRLEAELSRTMFEDAYSTLGLGGGLRYTDVKWSAYGGSFIYSDAGFRDFRGRFPDDERGISYRQQFPVAYAALNATHVTGDWRLAGALQGGLTVGARDTDDHWMRALRFEDRLDTAPVISANVEVGYQIMPNATFYLGAGLEKIFEARGDTTMVDTTSGASQTFADSAGGDFSAMSLSMGVKGRF
ncbi:omptin family outer membrane protease [Sinorhizobium sp. BG8]|uniref:omptin family outer membrane protease n=1 Tax=Sinorhizobium sp. BG8 TaxID=2613773 RepID=UPI00193D59CE|nr:omptin family outer membrane protease [Sinorhizobium sp. BG8]QRM54911.1 omptin family outer membrane protease [Sinorhizobium sp. BG8]